MRTLAAVAAARLVAATATLLAVPRAHATPTTTPRVEPPAEAKALSHAFTATARAVSPSVVRLEAEQRGARGASLSSGSGIILDGRGSIVTNRHVVDCGCRIVARLPDGRAFAARLVGADARTDLAVVRMDDPPPDLTIARLGDADRLDVGEWVLAVGSPLGLDQTFTAGIVSGKGHVGGKVRMSGDRVRGYIQTDAKINPGNSGGPLVNLEGEVVGINTLIHEGPGGSYGFAIPVNEVRQVAQSIVKEGRMRYAFLGVNVGDIGKLDDARRAAFGAQELVRGAFVDGVVRGSPAAQAGIVPGDVILAVDGKRIAGAAELIDTVAEKGVGAHVKLAFQHRGKPQSAVTTLTELPEPTAMR